MMPGNDVIPLKRQLKTNNISAAGGPAPKRLRFIKHIINSLEYSEGIVQAPGNTTNSAHPDLWSVLQRGQGDVHIYEEMLSGDYEDDVLVIGIHEGTVRELYDILNS
jgi:hypothetical protein